MPELPEVETIKLGLQKKIVGLTLKNIQVLNPKTFSGDVKLAEGKRVASVWRRAKMLGIDLTPAKTGPVASVSQVRPRSSPAGESLAVDARDLSSAPPVLTLLFHLKMTGQLIYIPNDEQRTANSERLIGGHPTPDMRNAMPNSHTRVIFEFSDPSRQKAGEASKSKLYFNDQRKFGWVKLLKREKEKVISDKSLENLGPEPLEKDFTKDFTWEVLKQNLLKHKSQPVKIAIMDQSVVSGVGNIYASEALFDAKIDPRKKISQLSDSEFKALFTGVREALTMGIKHGGSSRAHFVDADGKKGYFLDYANVYGKVGYSCKAGCGGKVGKITQAGRGTYYCPSCQK